jgi:hypothetical protein
MPSHRPPRHGLRRKSAGHAGSLQQHGHSVQTMLEVYAAWTEGATEDDAEAIKRAMQSSPRTRARCANTTASSPLASPRNLPLSEASQWLSL